MKRDPTLHRIIFEELQSRSPECAQRWEHLSPIVNIDDDRQAITAANQFWRLQLGALPESTTDVRYCLVDHVGFDGWLMDFIAYLIPTIVANGLPK